MNQPQTPDNEVARLREAIKPFLRFANGIPDNWPEQCILRFDQRNDGSLYINYYGVQDASDGITIKQWRQLLKANKTELLHPDSMSTNAAYRIRL